MSHVRPAWCGQLAGLPTPILVDVLDADVLTQMLPFDDIVCKSAHGFNLLEDLDASGDSSLIGSDSLSKLLKEREKWNELGLHNANF
ncbi:hypothetical protein PPROV_000919300 [Pycnococcus provasolii]|uniref:Uncharacterized protein n=1 Tax=Pycnococcus provasolii TaxID=41880 RepID=A0A830HTL3_9CHLO|nr:hypothetical protein PPROV_000919300 [Pycnococcus provasolii]|mmetsp:Transcript_6729/g.15309  ORF Transcript_6729/g.15309 Transcript_6729/m.15309 type:complete len:87 (-) Transcript_6729:136-396(-)